MNTKAIVGLLRRREEIDRYERSRSYGICLANGKRENTRRTEMMHGNTRATPMAIWRSPDALAP